MSDGVIVSGETTRSEISWAVFGASKTPLRQYPPATRSCSWFVIPKIGALSGVVGRKPDQISPIFPRLILGNNSHAFAMMCVKPVGVISESNVFGSTVAPTMRRPSALGTIYVSWANKILSIRSPSSSVTLKLCPLCGTMGTGKIFFIHAPLAVIAFFGAYVTPPAVNTLSWSLFDWSIPVTE